MSSALKGDLVALARQRGFADTRVTAARALSVDREVTLARVRAGSFSGLPWFDEDRVRRATDPERVLAGVRSVVLLLASYRHRTSRPGDTRPRGRISRYAWGKDYHPALEKRARPLLRLLDERAPGSRSRLLVDHGPLLERAYARAAGLGWQGKNTMLLSRGIGSYTFLAAILTTVELDEDPPSPLSCGSCTRCLPSCPTGALRSPYELVSDLCIAHHTIENRGVIPRELRALFGDWVFGCDLCQESCPVNDPPTPPGLAELGAATPDDAFPDLAEILELDEASFRRRFAGRAVMRAKYPGLLRNACIALGNSGNSDAIPTLERALAHPEPLVRGHAAWALGRLGARQALRARRAIENDSSVLAEIDASLAEGAAA